MTDITRGAGHACQQEINDLKALNAELVKALETATKLIDEARFIIDQNAGDEA